MGDFRMSTRLNYVEWDEISETNQQTLKTYFMSLEREIEDLLLNSREKSLAITKLEECWMWVGKAIKIDQEQRHKND
jgi:hypothetical protein